VVLLKQNLIQKLNFFTELPINQTWDSRRRQIWKEGS